MAQYFTSSNKRGELYELSEELNSVSFDRKKEAIKKVIAHMTIGKDVSPLFHPVVKCLEYDDIEMKKLVYLYIINYSRNRPDDAIVVIQLFRKDISNKTNPMLRALAVRTMGCLKVHKLNEYLADPLKDALNDKEPYVRKTAVLCIPKLYEVSPDLVDQCGLITSMQNLLDKESNALVLANLIVSLSEIQTLQKRKDLIKINPNILQRILLAVNECVEWGQIQIMEFLSNYIPADSKEAEMIVERILPRLSHINPSVVFAAVKVVIQYFNHIEGKEVLDHLCTKLTPSLVSLLSWDKSEVKFIILKSINHILAKQPGLLDKDIKYFFCSFNEPYYIKRQKLDIMARICDKKSCETVLNELELYVTESDPHFVRRSIKAICSIAIRFDSAVDKALKIILTCIKNVLEANMGGEQYVQEIIITMQKIFRRYHNKIHFENALEQTVNLLEYAHEEAAKSSAVWIMGEFAEKIPTSIELITTRIQSFSQEERGVQLEILTAAVKVFVKYPDDGKEFIQEILETAAYKTLNPDVRDRAFIYWRMLSSDAQQTKETVLCEKPDILEEGLKYEPEFLQVMLDTLGQVSSVFSIMPNKIYTGKYRPPGYLVSASRSEKPATVPQEQKSDSKQKPEKSNEEEKTSSESPSKKKEEPPKPASDNLLDFDDEPPKTQAQAQAQFNSQGHTTTTGGGENLMDLLDDFGSTPQNVVNNQQQQNDDFDMFGDSTPTQNQPKIQTLPVEQVLDPSTPGKQNGTTGMRVDAAMNRLNGKTILELRITNNTNQHVSNAMLSLRPNYFGLKFEQNQLNIQISQGQSQQVQVNINNQGNPDQNYPSVPLKFDIGLKTNFDVFYFQVPCMFHSIFGENGTLDKTSFRDNWKGVSDDNEMSFEVKNLTSQYKNSELLQQVLNKNNIFFVAQRQNDKGQTVGYYSAKTEAGLIFTIEISVPSQNNPNGASLSCKSQHKALIPLVLQCVNYILTH